MLTAPEPSSTCVNGFWQTPANSGTGGARIDRANGCVTAQPASDMICRNGLWTLRATEPSVQQPSLPGSSAITAPDASTSTTGTTTDPDASDDNLSGAAGRYSCQPRRRRFGWRLVSRFAAAGPAVPERRVRERSLGRSVKGATHVDPACIASFSTGTEPLPDRDRVCCSCRTGP